MHQISQNPTENNIYINQDLVKRMTDQIRGCIKIIHYSIKEPQIANEVGHWTIITTNRSFKFVI